MSKLNTGRRNALPLSSFALPGRRYPIEDPGHARAALSRGAQHASPNELATIRQKVRRRYPGIKVSGNG